MQNVISGGLSVWQPVTYVTPTEIEDKIEICDLTGSFYLIWILQMLILSINLVNMLQVKSFEKTILTSYDITYVT